MSLNKCLYRLHAQFSSQNLDVINETVVFKLKTLYKLCNVLQPLFVKVLTHVVFTIYVEVYK